jgi:hypothetical protein
MSVGVTSLLMAAILFLWRISYGEYRFRYGGYHVSYGEYRIPYGDNRRPMANIEPRMARTQSPMANIERLMAKITLRYGEKLFWYGENCLGVKHLNQPVEKSFVVMTFRSPVNSAHDGPLPSLGTSLVRVWFERFRYVASSVGRRVKHPNLL